MRILKLFKWKNLWMMPLSLTIIKVSIQRINNNLVDSNSPNSLIYPNMTRTRRIINMVSWVCMGMVLGNLNLINNLERKTVLIWHPRIVLSSTHPRNHWAHWIKGLIYVLTQSSPPSTPRTLMHQGEHLMSHIRDVHHLTVIYLVRRPSNLKQLRVRSTHSHSRWPLLLLRHRINPWMKNQLSGYRMIKL